MGTRNSKVVVARCVKNGRRMWRVNVPVGLAGRRMRRFFLSEREAVEWAGEFEETVRVHGRAALEVSGKTVREVLERFWVLKEMEGRHAGLARTILGQFSAKYGAVPIKMVRPLQLQMFWTRDEWSRTYRATVFRYLRLFFNWAERYEYIEGNPARRVEPPKVGELPKRILEPETMARLLQKEDAILRAFLVLGGFAGLRSSEILRLRTEDIGNTEIHVRSGKTGERFVAVLPAFLRWWRSLPEFPPERAFYAHLVDVTGGRWPANCLRHSFGTYHLARWQDAAKTAFQMGNSQAVVIRSYARAVPFESSERWWLI